MFSKNVCEDTLQSTFYHNHTHVLWSKNILMLEGKIVLVLILGFYLTKYIIYECSKQ